jgi:hypothetical protein
MTAHRDTDSCFGQTAKPREATLSTSSKTGTHATGPHNTPVLQAPPWVHWIECGVIWKGGRDEPLRPMDYEGVRDGRRWVKNAWRVGAWGERGWSVIMESRDRQSTLDLLCRCLVVAVMGESWVACLSTLAVGSEDIHAHIHIHTHTTYLLDARTARPKTNTHTHTHTHTHPDTYTNTHSEREREKHVPGSRAPP